MENKYTLRIKAANCGVPEHTIDGLVDYIENGIPTGDFLYAVLTNNLMEAFGRADEKNSKKLQEICSFIYNYAPIGCHGSKEKVANWIDSFSKRDLFSKGKRHFRGTII